MDIKLLAPEWQALSEGLQAIIDQHRHAETGSKSDHIAAADRVEGFLTSLRGVAASWAQLAKGLPQEDTTTVEAAGHLSQWRFYKPLAQALFHFGGRAKTRDAIAKVGEILAAQLQAGDNELLQSGQVRWMANVRFARQELRERNLMTPTDPGLWELSAAGHRWAESDAEAIPAPVPPDIPGQASFPF